MIDNPELQRNLWLELTAQRLLLLPTVLAIVVVTIVVSSPPEVRASALFVMGVMTMFGGAVFWGARLAADSLQDEYTAGTWDTQRMSGLSAWAIVCGKLFGGAFMAWYVGAWGLLMILASALFGTSAMAVVSTALSLLGLAVIAQAGALLITLAALQKARANNTPLRRNAASGVVLLSFATLWLTGVLGGAMAMLQDEVAYTRWFGLVVPSSVFGAFCCVSYGAWAMFGARQLMRTELLEHNSPWWWSAFLLFAQLHIAGLAAVPAGQASGLLASIGEAMPGSAAKAAVLAAAALPLLFTYAFVFAEPKQRVQLAQLLERIRSGRLKQAFATSPLWLRSLLHACASLLVAMAVALLADDASTAVAFCAGAAALMLFSLRDVAIVLAANSGASQRRADSAAFAYLVLLYLIAPMLLTQLDAGGLLGALVPVIAFVVPAWIVAAVLWCGGALWLLQARWRRSSVPTQASSLR